MKNFWSRLRLIFSSSATLVHRAWDIAESVLPDLVAAGCADPSISDAERRTRVKHALAGIIAERYPGVPVGLLDVALGFALDLLRSQIAKR